MTDDEIPPDDREDMLSILRDLRPYYFWILIVQIAIWSVVVFLSERSNCAEVGTSGCVVTMGLKMSGLVPLMLLVSVILVDTGRYLMVLLRNSRERLITQARKKAKAEGKAEGEAIGASKVHTKWGEWNTRRIEHERRGEPFDEPPPSLDDYIDTDNNHR